MSTTLLKKLREQQNQSERVLAARAGISRLTLRHLEAGTANITLDSHRRLCEALGRSSQLLVFSRNIRHSDSSTIAISYKMLQGGFDSWPYHLMEFVDDFRKTLDPRLVLLPPTSHLDARLTALIASTTWQVCDELGCAVPEWAVRSYFLEIPWFVSEMESLKAMAILESPLPFRRNNIFVQENFLMRA